MKIKAKSLFVIAVSVTIGVGLGYIVFSEYRRDRPVMRETDIVFFLQQGVYSSMESLNAGTQNLSSFIYFEEENLFRVYVYITTSMENAQKVERIFADRGVEIFIKEGTINDTAFVEKLRQYDRLISETNDEGVILGMTTQILNEYKMVLNSE